jgi:hypothetical protein
MALLSYEQERGRTKVALGYVDELLRQPPGDPALQTLREQLAAAK